MAKKYADEVAAIRKIRDMFPTRPALALAKQIYGSKFPLDSAEQKLSYDATMGYDRETGIRSVLSVYSVLRRHDARRITEGLANLVESGITAANAAI